jgi:hypothetical protein
VTVLHFEISGLVLTFFFANGTCSISKCREDNRGRTIGLFIFEAWGGLPTSGKGSKDLV